MRRRNLFFFFFDERSSQRKLEASEKAGEDLARWRVDVENKLNDTCGMVIQKTKRHDADRKEDYEKLLSVEQALEREKKELQKSKEAFKTMEEAHNSMKSEMDRANMKIKSQEDELLRLGKLSVENAADAYKHKVRALPSAPPPSPTLWHECMRTRIDGAMALARRPACRVVELCQFFIFAMHLSVGCGTISPLLSC